MKHLLLKHLAVKNFALLLLLPLTCIQISSARSQGSATQASPAATYAVNVKRLYKASTPAIHGFQALFARERGLQQQKAARRIDKATYAKQAVTSAEWKKSIADLHGVAAKFRSLGPVPASQRTSKAHFVDFADSLDRSMNGMTKWVETRNNSLIPKVVTDMNAAMAANLAGAKAIKK